MDDTTADHENRFRVLAERQIRDAILAGEFDNLPGIGQALTLEENPFVPDEWRMAFKVLQNSGHVPPWIALAQEVDADIALWRRLADDHFATVRARLDAAVVPGALGRMRNEIATLKAQHVRATERHAAQLDEINRKIRYLNASVPIDSAQRLPLIREDEMRAWADRLPAYLNY